METKPKTTKIMETNKDQWSEDKAIKIAAISLLIIMIINVACYYFFDEKKIMASNISYNGEAQTPPMGWNSWNKFGCDIDDSVIRQTADVMSSNGMSESGYKYIVIDDCWQMVERDVMGHLQPDPVKFPHGIKDLADYVHSKGLKLGIYSCAGYKTCQGRAGSYSHEIGDARDFASWGVDYLKYDNCNYPSDMSDEDSSYRKMKSALLNCGRNIVFSIATAEFEDWQPHTGNLWRTTEDIKPNWESVYKIYRKNMPLFKYAHRGAWNDPDMLEIGNGSLTLEECRTHMSLWSMMSSPLIAGNDLRDMRDDIKSILIHKEVIAINQDSLGMQCHPTRCGLYYDVLCKPLSDTLSKAVAILNYGDNDAEILIRWNDFGIKSKNCIVRDVWAMKNVGEFEEEYAVAVKPHQTILLKITGK